MEAPVELTSGSLRLEGMLETASPARAVVLTHPHPLYGGDMDNPVVLAVRRAYARKGVSTLRFNFRGVGESEGRYDNGAGERLDVIAAMAWLNARGITEIDLAGYSFGAWVNAGVTHGFRRMIMVSPPVVFMDFGPAAPIANLELAVTGGRDDIAPAEAVSTYLSRWNPAAALEVIPEADHFYTGFFRTLENIIAARI
jgi:alpha/beta superfamily hydrolase